MQGEAQPRSPEDRTDTESISWSEVKALFEAALPLHGADRDAFLETNCRQNSQLKQEVESLLQSYETTGDFLDRPIASVASILNEDLLPGVKEPNYIGVRLGAYRLEQEIGRGGMGAVYLATRADSEFDKRVAIKLINQESVTAMAVNRFRRERQILARLENAYIARLLDGGTTAEGLPYFVMEYVEGKPINKYCDDESLTIRDRLNLFIKVCSAVQYAHARNIVHRDLKPGNILVKKDGTPKLLDFGIAKILTGDAPAGENDATHQTVRILTPAYASPEQLRAGIATTRSDIYSLGIVLYELLCGKRPDHTYFHKSETPASRAGEAHVSSKLRSVVLRAIHPDPAERYVSVEAFSADIRRYLSGAPPIAASGEAVPETASKMTLAVLPFRILGDQNSRPFLAPGITETLITKLSRIDRLSIPPPSAILKYANGVEAVRAARELHVEYVLEGSLQIFGDAVRASVQLVFAEAGIAVWAGQVEATEATLVRLEDAIAEQVADAVLPHLTGEERAEISRSGTDSGAAHAAYLRGRYFWNNAFGDQEALLKSLVCFTEAIEIDPKFARAHAGIADYYLRMGLWGSLPPSESFAASVESARTAVNLDPTLGEAHASLAFATWAYQRDEEAAERHFSLAILRNPNYANAHHWFGLLKSSQNRPELAIASLERAQKVDPNNVLIATALGFVYYNARQFATSLRFLHNAARELPKSGIIQEMLTWCTLQTGDIASALEHARRAVHLTNRASASLSALAHAEAAAGNPAVALELKKELEERAVKMYVSKYDRASIALAAAHVPEAIAFLEQARDDRDWWFSWIEVDPRWDPLRKEPRFRKLLPQREPVRRNKFTLPALVAVCAVVLALIGVSWWLARPRRLPFTNAKFTKLTTNGTAESAIISPDGKSVIYSTHELSGMALWRRDLQTGRVIKLVDGIEGRLGDLGFTNYGAAIQFVNSPLQDPAIRHLFIAPVNGGAPTQIQQNFQGPVSLSIDGNQAAFFAADMQTGANQLFLLNVKSGARRLLATYKNESRFAWNCRPAWSSDSKRIAFASEAHDRLGFLISVNVINVSSAAQQTVYGPRWQWVQSIEWTHDNSAMAIVGQEHESSFQQIWYVPYQTSRGGVRRVGNDLDDYVGASLNARGSAMVSVQSQTLSNIYVASEKDVGHAKQVTPGSGRYFDLAWLPDGRILYASDATGTADLWIMNRDGSGQRQVNVGGGRNYAPATSPDGRMIAFHSNRSGNWQVWRTNIDGTEPKQLSSNAGDGNWPQFSIDGREVLYHRSSSNGIFNLWRVPAQGGVSERFTTAMTMHPAVSPLHGQVAAWYSEKTDIPEWKLAVFAATGGQPLRVIAPTHHARPDTPIHWMPKGDAIAALDYGHSATNIWSLPVDGSAPRQLTSFDSGEIYSFDWSPKGALVFSHGLTTSDVVLIRDENAPEFRNE
jgi:serine/threonine protein kinase/Tol biopolymer transport system component/tetratricopeptide (TPR) repeat protein